MFTGRRYDDETGLYYYRARCYAPQIGRFMQTDPIRYAAGLNLYTYVGNNPLNWLDPWGLKKGDGEDDEPEPPPDPPEPDEPEKPEPEKPEPEKPEPEKPEPEKPEPKKPEPKKPERPDRFKRLRERLNIRKRFKDIDKDMNRMIDEALSLNTDKAMAYRRSAHYKGCRLGADLIRVAPGTTVRPRPTPYRRR